MERVPDGSLRQLTEACWAAVAAARPSFAEVEVQLATVMRTYSTSDFKRQYEELGAELFRRSEPLNYREVTALSNPGLFVAQTLERATNQASLQPCCIPLCSQLRHPPVLQACCYSLALAPTDGCL
eukprot:6158245-Prymnesium_polylepis.1